MQVYYASLICLSPPGAYVGLATSQKAHCDDLAQVLQDNQARINSMDFHRTEDMLVTASDDDSIHVYNTGAMQTIAYGMGCCAQERMCGILCGFQNLVTQLARRQQGAFTFIALPSAKILSTRGSLLIGMQMFLLLFLML
eukprot:1159533-Pelagomonas_calceolata.AAC.1